MPSESSDMPTTQDAADRAALAIAGRCGITRRGKVAKDIAAIIRRECGLEGIRRFLESERACMSNFQVTHWNLEDGRCACRDCERIRTIDAALAKLGPAEAEVKP